MASTKATVRQSVSLPPELARQVRSIAKNKRQSANRVLVDLIEQGIDAQKRKQQDFFVLAERFRASNDESEIKRLGEELGRMVFGD
jgi:predicted transcriptional regulator